MNILLSAYHCAPNLGSESAVGWNYAVQLRQMGHKVWVITSDTRKPFYKNTSVHEQLGIDVIFFGLPGWMKRFYKPNTTSEHLYYLFWQIGLFFFCRKLMVEKQIELIHHVTLGSFRVPSFLWLYKAPFIFGPVGGGEDPPESLFKSIKSSHRTKERFRKWMNLLFVLNPFYLLNLFRSKLILLKNKDTLKYIPEFLHHKCKIDIGIGVTSKGEAIQVKRRDEQQKFRILYAGRLLYWKGLHLSIKAIAGLGEDKKDVQYTVVGSGVDEQWLKNLAAEYKVTDSVNWIPKVEQKMLFQMYQDYDILLFPSYHDSSGMVVMEAMSFGLPVICLDLGGPKEVVDNSCGIIVSTKNKNEQEIVEDLSRAIAQLKKSPDMLYSMGHSAVATANGFTWEKVVKGSYDFIEEALGKNQPNGKPIARPSGKVC